MSYTLNMYHNQIRRYRQKQVEAYINEKNCMDCYRHQHDGNCIALPVRAGTVPGDQDLPGI